MEYLTSSRTPLYQSPPALCEPRRIRHVVVIAPVGFVAESLLPSTVSKIRVPSRTHFTWCQRPSTTFGPRSSCLLPREPRNMHDAWPFGWTSILIWPPLLEPFPS